jgi:hypothetical protein
MDLKTVRCKSVEWIEVTNYSLHFWTLVNKAMKIYVKYIRTELLLDIFLTNFPKL